MVDPLARRVVVNFRRGRCAGQDRAASFSKYSSSPAGTRIRPPWPECCPRSNMGVRPTPRGLKVTAPGPRFGHAGVLRAVPPLVPDSTARTRPRRGDWCCGLPRVLGGISPPGTARAAPAGIPATPVAGPGPGPKQGIHVCPRRPPQPGRNATAHEAPPGGPERADMHGLRKRPDRAFLPRPPA